MPPSSLIFVVILAVWGAYLVQHWVRRRDHIATARSVDRFSEAMRVLERRQQAPAPGAHPVPRSYAVSPIRRVTAQETVEEVAPVAPESPSRVTAARAMAGAAAGRAAAGTAGVSRAARAGARTAASGARSARDGARSAVSPLSSIRRRSAMLLVGSTAMVLGTVLGLVGVWPWWTAAAGIAAFLLAGVLVRWSVRRARPAMVRRRSERSTTSRGGRRPASRTPGRATVATRPVPSGLSRPEVRRGVRPDVRPEARPPARPDLVPGEVVARPVRPTTRTAAVGGAAAALAARGRPATPRSRPVTAVYDIDAVEGRTTASPAASGTTRRRQGPAAPGSWEPVPVPPPTYTLKARATPRPTEAPVVVPAAASTPPEDLPFDGLALAFAEESEELPAVRTQP